VENSVIAINSSVFSSHTQIMTESLAEIPGRKTILSENNQNITQESELCELLDGVRVTSPDTCSEGGDSLSRLKNRNDSGCSYEENGANSNSDKKIGGSGHSTDSGHGSNDIEEGMIFAYHFMIPSHLCGILIGAQGKNVKHLRAATKCEVSLVTSNYEGRVTKAEGYDTEPQICILQGTRSGIERCLELIQEKIPLHENPDFDMKQINEPTNETDLLNNQINEGLLVTLPAGKMATAVMTAIVSPAHFFIQLPETSTFQHLSRLEDCMLYVYEKMQDRAPKVPCKSIDTGLVCVTKQNDKYYRIQVVTYDISNECCEVKFLDYGGTEKVLFSDMWQIRQDFLNLPFQAVECYLSNVIPPPSCTEWPFESIVYLEELTRGKTLSCREIGVAEDSTPIVQLYITYTDESGQLETRFVNKELVDKGAAQWVEHSSV